MPTPLQAQIEDLARRLSALERELGELRRLAAATEEPEPAPPLKATLTVEPAGAAEPEPVAARQRWLTERLELAHAGIANGDVKTALKFLEGDRKSALAAKAVPELRQILELAGLAAAASDGRSRAAAERLAYAVQQNIRFLERKQTLAGGPPATAPRPPGRTAPVVPRPTPAPAVTPEPVPPPAREPAAPSRPASRGPAFELPRFEASDLLGPKALAIAGGIVTLLGILFFFVLAVNRGWIGPVGRVGLGAAASLCVFFAGVELRRRYGETHAALAAVGVGIAGGYATLLAAAALYDLLPDYAALVVAAAIAAVGVVTSIHWRSQLIAGLGLIGAMLVPVAVVVQDGPSPLGTAFVALVLAANGVVALRQRWRELLLAGVAVSLPQIVALVFQSQYHGQSPWRIVVLAAVFSLLYLATGIAFQLRRGTAAVGQISTSLIGIGGVLAAAAAVRLFPTPEQRSLALLVVTLVYGLLAAFFLRRPAGRDLSAFLASIAFIFGAVAFAGLLDGRTLTYAWAAEAAALAWLARRTRELRFQIWSLGYLGLALGHLLVVDAPPSRLFSPSSHPAAGAAAAVATALAASVFAYYARPWADHFVDRGGLYSHFAGVFSRFEASQRLLRSSTLWLAGVLATYAVSLGTLALFSSFDWGWVALAAIWSALGLGILLAGLRVDSAELRNGGLIWLAATLVLVIAEGGATLAPIPRWWAFLVVAGALVSAGLAYQLLGRTAPARRMDLSALLASVGVAVGAVATAGLLGGEPLAYAWAAEAAVLAWLAWRVEAPHFQMLSAASLGLALAHVLAIDAPPRRLFTASAHPAHGALTAVAVAAALAIFAFYARPRTTERADADDGYELLAGLVPPVVARQTLLRHASLWLGGIVATYALSLGTLALFSSFDWGWVALATIWSALGLGILLAGLRADSAELCNGGLAWLATTLVVVVLEGQATLTPTSRSWSYLVVAAAVLAAGLAYEFGRKRPVAVESVVAVVAVLASLALACDSIVALLNGERWGVDLQGLGFLGLAVLYGAIAAAVFRRPGQRDFSTLLWSIALVLAAVAAYELLGGTFLVLAFAAAGAVLSWLSARTSEKRFQIGAAAYLGLALARAVVVQAPPTHLFVQGAHHGSGVASLFIVAAGIGVLARYLMLEADTLRLGRVAAWTAGVVAVYAVSLAILDLVQRLFPGAALQTNWQRGHTAVSAFWGLLGLALLYAGLKRWPALRVAGLVLFVVSLGKIFAYDLPSLSSVTRALSFLAVGAVLLLGGFFYQRQQGETSSRRR